MLAMENLRRAFGFLSVLPVGEQREYRPGDLGRAAPWFPLVGLVIGLVTGLTAWGSGMVLPPLPAAVICMLVWEGLSGGLHLDGLADCCDGLLPTASKEKRLEIMRDSRLGAFGVAGLVLYLLLKVSLILSLRGWTIWLAFPLAAAGGRWLVLWASRQPMARPGGLGAEMAQVVTPTHMLAAGVLPLLLALLGGWRGLLGVWFAALAGWGVFSLSRKRIGGVTGDVMGMAIELGELACLLPFCLTLGG